MGALNFAPTSIAGEPNLKWEDYKPLVQASREVIVYPYLARSLHGQSGICLDVGCGSGDLTCFLANATKLQIIGIDRDIPSSAHEQCAKSSVHLVKGTLEKNGILEVGVTFDCAYSNCCFCHLSDEVFVEVLVDLYNSIRNGGRLVFLVPSIEWAREMYSDIEYVASGITAAPRYGGRQHFRSSAWYMSALARAGFKDVRCEQVLIPDDERLEARYRERHGLPLLTAFYATRDGGVGNSEAIMKAFDIAHENRKLEIQLFWQRSLFFWGFVAAALFGYVGALNEHSHLTVIFALFGLVCSIVWSQGNRGSKYWQEYWEKKVNFYQHHATGNIFYDRKPTNPSFWQVFEGRRISVSKLTMALSDFTVFLWLLLCVGALVDPVILKNQQGRIAPILLLATLGYCLYFLRKSKSED